MNKQLFTVLAEARQPNYMNDQAPIVRKTSWLSLIPQVLMLFALIIVSWKIVSPDNFWRGSIWGPAVYLLYSFGSKAILLKHHRKGIQLSKLNRYDDAIPEFESSYQFLSRYEWVDKFRFITMLDSSAVSYREMALCNIAYAHVQLGENLAALQYYRRALEEFPQSDLAKTGVLQLEADANRN